MRKRIGLVFTVNENWIGGTYYVLNLISALNALDDHRKPLLVIFYWADKDVAVVKETGYPYLEFRNLVIGYSLGERIINRAARLCLNRDLIVKTFSDKDVDLVFPYEDRPVLRTVSRKVHWIPDLQSHYLTEFFSPDQLAMHHGICRDLAGNRDTVVFSSREARNDFFKFYPEARSRAVAINFAVFHPPFGHLDLDGLKRRYGINRPYFFAPNQFWAHKNHGVALRAAKRLAEEREDFQLIFTGKEYDHRNPGYTDTLKAFVEQHQLGERVKFLGFIDRKEQLQLMKHALAVIQPSRFEGWSTVVEDAKAMGQFVLLSDLPVHREQAAQNALFFDPADAGALQHLMIRVLEGRISREPLDYGLCVRKFADEFMAMAEGRPAAEDHRKAYGAAYA